jgi:hypothetical protein
VFIYNCGALQINLVTAIFIGTNVVAEFVSSPGKIAVLYMICLFSSAIVDKLSPRYLRSNVFLVNHD